MPAITILEHGLPHGSGLATVSNVNCLGRFIRQQSELSSRLFQDERELNLTVSADGQE